MKMNRRLLATMAGDKLDDYDEVMINDLIHIITDELSGLEVSDISIDTFQEILDSWAPPEAYDWAYDEAISEYEMAMDAKYESMKDERMGL